MLAARMMTPSWNRTKKESYSEVAIHKVVQILFFFSRPPLLSTLESLPLSASLSLVPSHHSTFIDLIKDSRN